MARGSAFSAIMYVALVAWSEASAPVHDATPTMHLRCAVGEHRLRMPLRGGAPPVQTFGATTPPRIIISGAPASGKGTQCEFIKKKLGVVHISTGDALREQVNQGTQLGKMAKEFMNKGELVPDSVIIDIVKDRLAQSDCQTKGWLLDGFPRTGVQAEALKNAGIEADKFILLNVPDADLIERCVGRRTDPQTGEIYHLKFNPPPEDPAVMARLVHRGDDTEEAMEKRLQQYRKNVNAIRAYYKHITKEFEGKQDKMTLAEQIHEFLTSDSTPSAGSLWTKIKNMFSFLNGAKGK